MDEHEELHATVQQLIRALTMSQAELARRLEVSPGTLYSWAVGRRTPSPANSARLAELAERQAAAVAEAARRLSRATGEDREGEKRDS